MSIKNVIIPTTGISILVVFLTWLNIKEYNMEQNVMFQKMMRGFLISFFVTGTCLYFFTESSDEVIDNMIKSPPKF